MTEIGFGGSCHWCTEAIFSSLNGVTGVQQGWIAAAGEDQNFSEAVIVKFDEATISVDTLIAIHLYTHSCTSNHHMRLKYRSAVYTFTLAQSQLATDAIKQQQSEFNAPIITQVLPFGTFKLNAENYLNYYYNDPEKPFCENVVNPKLRLLMERFSHEVDHEKLVHLTD